MRRLAATTALLCALALVQAPGPVVGSATGVRAGVTQAVQADWTGSWATSPDPVRDELSQGGLRETTVRHVVRLSVGGDQVRVRLSHAYGAGTLTVARVTVGLRSRGAGVRAGTLRQVRFEGRRGVRIARGTRVTSDPVRLPVADLSDLTVSMYVEGPTGPITQHPIAGATGYLATDGDRTGESAGTGFTGLVGSWLVLEGVDVRRARQARRARPAGAVVALGDSLVDGFAATPDADRRWPDVLARRFHQRCAGGRDPRAPGVLNAGLSGNRVLGDVGEPGFYGGESAQARLDRDVLQQTGVRAVVVAAGLNDIGTSTGTGPGRVTSGRLIEGLARIARRSRDHGLVVVGGTLTPFEGADYYTARGERVRQRVNRWIRTTGAFDAVADFDRATRDPRHPRRLRPALDSGDHLHPDDDGYLAMGRAVPLGALAPGRCAR